MNGLEQSDAAANGQSQTVSGVRLAPGHQARQRAAALSVAGSLIWPLQAALVTVALGGLLTGVPFALHLVVLGYFALGALRALIGMIAEQLAQQAARDVVHGARTRIVTVETARAEDSSFGGAGSISALASEKLDLLAPYVTRYAPARARAAAVRLLSWRWRYGTLGRWQ